MNDKPEPIKITATGMAGAVPPATRIEYLGHGRYRVITTKAESAPNATVTIGIAAEEEERT